jgi:hypothetical protein
VILAIDAYLDVITEEVDRIVDLAVDAPHAQIFTRPGYRIDDLVAELAARLTEWGERVGGSDAVSARDAESHAGVLEVAVDALVEALEAARAVEALEGEPREQDDSADEGLPGRLRCRPVARLAALTCAIYRSDIERAAGKSGRIDTELAQDGVDERLERYCLESEQASSAIWEGSMCLVAVDVAAAWLLEGRRGRCTWRKGRGPAVTAVVGHASDLLLFTWGRLSPDDLAITGDFSVARRWREEVDVDRR